MLFLVHTSPVIAARNTHHGDSHEAGAMSTDEKDKCNLMEPYPDLAALAANAISAEGKDVVVLGGGDTAVDCVATCIRMGAKSVTQFSRRDKASESRPKHTPWPYWADVYRVDYAHREHEASHGKDPREYRVTTSSFEPSKSDPKSVGSVKAKRAPAQPGNEGKVLKKVASNAEVKDVTFPADLVVLAMGFTGPDAAVDPEGRLPRVGQNFDAPYGDYRVKNGPFDGLFAAGDCRRGASLVVTAIAEGRDAAHRIDEYLMGESILPRCAPLSANPTFYVRDWADTTSSAVDLRRKKTQKQRQVAAVSEQFERGYLGEDALPTPRNLRKSGSTLAPKTTSNDSMRPPLALPGASPRVGPKESVTEKRLEDENRRLREQLLKMKETMQATQDQIKEMGVRVFVCVAYFFCVIVL